MTDAIEPIPASSRDESLLGQVVRELVALMQAVLFAVLTVAAACVSLALCSGAGYCLWTAAGIETSTRDYYLYGGGGLVLAAVELAIIVSLFRAAKEQEPQFRPDILG